MARQPHECDVCGGSNPPRFFVAMLDGDVIEACSRGCARRLWKIFNAGKASGRREAASDTAIDRMAVVEAMLSAVN